MIKCNKCNKEIQDLESYYLTDGVATCNECYKPTLQEAKKITDAKYNLQDSLEEQRERSEMVIDYQISENDKKIQDVFIEENKAKMEEYKTLEQQIEDK